MNDEQIRERCEKALESIITFDLPTNEEAGKRLYDRQAKVLESLYREAMAVGLEMAADIVWSESEGDIDLARFKCRREAVRVKGWT